MQKKPIIGLVPLVDEGRDSLWMLPGYMEGVRQGGGIPLMLPLNGNKHDLRQLFDLCNGLIFTGGHDVGAEVYGAEHTPLMGDTCPGRDAMETVLLDMAVKENKPVLGICRGLQLINAALGGSLYQDLQTLHPSDVCHRQPAPYDQPSHSVHLPEDSPLRAVTGKDMLQVNSCHHQGIERLAPSLRVTAIAPDGLVEGIDRPGSRLIWAVQWHPEFSWKVNEDSRAIFRAFVQGCTVC